MVLVFSLLAFLGCAEDDTDTPSQEPGTWVEVEAEIYYGCDDCTPYWRAESPVPGPVPAMLWLFDTNGQIYSAREPIEWYANTEMRSSANDPTQTARYDVWVDPE